MSERQKREPEFPLDEVRAISVAVYKMRLGPEAVERMIAKDGDDGTKLRHRAESYESLTRCYMRVLAHMMKGRES